VDIAIVGGRGMSDSFWRGNFVAYFRAPNNTTRGKGRRSKLNPGRPGLERQARLWAEAKATKITLTIDGRTCRTDAEKVPQKF